MKVLKRITKWSAGMITCLALVSLASCGDSNSNGSQSDLTDAQIASIAVTANQIDVDYAEIALKKASTEDAKNFAATMKKDHENIISQAVALAKKLDVTPDNDNDMTKSLLDGEKTTTAKLNGLEGADFDKAYIDNEVAYHKAVISAVEDKLIPQTTNKQLKDLLTGVLPLLKEHLKMAESAQKDLNQSADVPKLNDAEIASVAVTANQIDVNYAEIALKKATNEDEKNFAATMKKDHENIIKQAVALATKLGVTPEDNDVTQSLLNGEKDVTDKLNSLDGADFNKAYIDNEVAYHKAVIGAIKNVLIPQTQNEELKDLLTSVMPLLNQHLEMAKKAQAKLEN